MLRRLFRDAPGVEVHDPLPALAALGDEGAANHTRLCGADGIGHHLLVHGRAGDLPAAAGPQRWPARQTREASAAVARLGRLPAGRALSARQHPAGIDAGAFHNDVVMVGDGDRLLLHGLALVDQAAVLDELRRRVPGLRVAEIGDEELSLAEAVASYLFNSQLLATPGGHVLVAPAQAGEGRAGAAVRRLIDQGFIARAEFIDLGESMANGGGPACLRLRVPLAPAELAGLAPGVRLDEARLDRLEAWVDRHYREQLGAGDLADPRLVDEGRVALDELTALLGLGPLYAFQR
jgi:succinylarginine dihydrolase